jgi:hypothetical protein
MSELLFYVCLCLTVAAVGNRHLKTEKGVEAAIPRLDRVIAISKE